MDDLRLQNVAVRRLPASLPISRPRPLRRDTYPSQADSASAPPIIHFSAGHNFLRRRRVVAKRQSAFGPLAALVDFPWVLARSAVRSSPCRAHSFAARPQERPRLLSGGAAQRPATMIRECHCWLCKKVVWKTLPPPEALTTLITCLRTESPSFQTAASLKKKRRPASAHAEHHTCISFGGTPASSMRAFNKQRPTTAPPLRTTVDRKLIPPLFFSLLRAAMPTTNRPFS